MTTFANSVGFSDSKSAPNSPCPSRSSKAGMSLATTQAPPAKASAKIIPKDSPPVLGATYKATEDMKSALSSSEILPRNSNRCRSCGSILLITSSGSPGPATKTFTSGAKREITGKASTRTLKPFRGSSNLPINPIVFPDHFSCNFPCAYRLA